MSAPSSANTWVMPTFLPMIPSIAISFTCVGSSCARPNPGTARRSRALQRSFSERLDLHVHTRGELELHQRVDGLRSRLENVQQPLVGPHLELLARFLIHVRAA